VEAEMRHVSVIEKLVMIVRKSIMGSHCKVCYHFV